MGDMMLRNRLGLFPLCFYYSHDLCVVAHQWYITAYIILHCAIVDTQLLCMYMCTRPIDIQATNIP